MTVITIREQSAADSSFVAQISFDHQGAYTATIAPPFDDEHERLLEWYFEEHLQFPFTRQVDARTAAASITSYGEALFDQVFADGEAHAEYVAARRQGVGQIQFEIIGSAEFHRLHWEALKDSTLPRAFSLDSVMVRKHARPQPVRAHVRPAPTINLLLVVARPSGARDVGYRTISRPLVEELRKAGLPVQIDIVRPGSYEALDTHLQATTAKHGVGYYHVIHFDVHGAVLTYQELQNDYGTSQILYQNQYGRPDIQPYNGYKAFLFFEPDRKEQSHTTTSTQDKQAAPFGLAEAQALADLLINHHIPIAVLNACQSGKQIGTEETSLGSRLMQAGVQLVVAMGYSVTVSAAEIMMHELYQQLFNKTDLANALRLARRALFNRKNRRAYFNQTIELEDWLLPVVYQNQPLQLAPRPFTTEEAQQFFGQQAQQFAFPNPTYGFWGRDLDILEIERRLLQRNNVLLVRGMGGAGKTTLLRHLGAWWQTTHFVEQVFEFAYDQRAWTRQQIMDAIAQRVLSQVEYLTLFQPLALDAQQAMLTQRLRGTRHLVILDNLESITGVHLAIQHTLPPDEQQALRRLVTDLKGGRTLVLLGSRGGEEWLQQGTFDQNVYDLPGLDSEAASSLADAILERNRATQYRKHPELVTLLKLLGGYPLPMEVVLANLQRQTPAEVLDALQAGDVKIDPKANSHEKTASILQCINYSHSNLSPDAQALLVCLAPFTGVLYTSVLDAYIEQLKQQPALVQLPFERWQEVLQEAINWGLLSAHPHVNGFLQLQPVLPYFLRSRLNDPEQEDVRHAIETAFRQHYDGLGGTFSQLLKSKEPQERQVGKVVVSLEYENLVNALNIALAAQVSIVNLYLALSLYLDTTNDHQRGLELGEAVLAQLEQYPGEALTGTLGAEFVGVIDYIAKRQLMLKQYGRAEELYKQALDIWLKNTSFDREMVHRTSASIYHQLGYVAHEQRQWPQAEHYFQQALHIKVEFNDRYAQAATYHQLGRVAHEQRQWTQAEHYFQQALHIKVEFNDRYAQATTLHALGAVVQEQGKFEQAEDYYQQALALYIEFKDRFWEAGAYHQLGHVAEEQRQWEQAERYFQQALHIFIEFNDRYAQAKTYHQLGHVAEEQRQWEQAERYFQQALHIFIEFNDRYLQAAAYHQLGRVAQQQRQWEQAREYVLKDLEITAEFKDEYGLGITLRTLARLWRDSGDATLPAAIAQVLEMKTKEVEALLRRLLEEMQTSDESETTEGAEPPNQ